MASKAGIINADTGTIVGVPDALVQVGGVWTIAATAPGTVPASRQINTTAPLTGGGDLSADRTLAIAAATAGNDGYMTSTQVATLATAASTASTAQTTANAALPKAGGTMTGQIDMSNQKIVSLGTPIVSTDAATKGYVDTSVVGLLDLQGTIDCSANPNYPAANKGDVWVVSVAGLIGGGAGISVQAGDALVALVDNPGGTQAAVGSSWSILQANLVGALLAVNNLSDVQNVVTARANLGLGSAATQNTSAFATAAQGTLASTAVQRAGDTMTGTLTISNGANLILTGGSSVGQGNIQLGASPSLFYDSNVIYLDNTTKTLGFIAGSTPAFLSSNGSYFAARGNTYTAVSGQRGNVLFMAGAPSSAGATEGQLTFGTADTIRMVIAKDGKTTFNNGPNSGTGLVNIAGSATGASGGDSTVFKITTNLTALTNGDAYHTWFVPAITKQSTGTHGTFTGILISAPTIGGGAASLTTAATMIILGAPTGATNNYAMWIQGGLTRLDGTFQLGSSGTALSQMRVYTPTLTPAAVGTGAPTEQTFTVTGLATSDTVTVNAPGAAVFSARVSAANTLALTFVPAGTGTYTPPAGTYRIVAIRS